MVSVLLHTKTRKEAYFAWNLWKKNHREDYENLRSECRACKSKENLTINHIDGDKFNNMFENLECLCWHCHMLWQKSTLVVRYTKRESKQKTSKIDERRTLTGEELMKKYYWDGKCWTRKDTHPPKIQQHWYER